MASIRGALAAFEVLHPLVGRALGGPINDVDDVILFLDAALGGRTIALGSGRALIPSLLRTDVRLTLDTFAMGASCYTQRP